MRESKPKLLFSDRIFKIDVPVDIYFVICTSRDGDSYEMNNARAYELEKTLHGTGDLDVKLVNGKRVTQYKGIFKSRDEDPLEFNKRFGQSLAKAFGSPVWLHWKDEREYLLTGNSVEKTSGDISTAVEKLIGEKIETISDLCYRKANNGSMASHRKTAITFELEKSGINAIATRVKLNCPEDDWEVEPELKLVRQQIIATID